MLLKVLRKDVDLVAVTVHFLEEDCRPDKGIDFVLWVDGGLRVFLEMEFERVAVKTHEGVEVFDEVVFLFEMDFCDLDVCDLGEGFFKEFCEAHFVGAAEVFQMIGYKPDVHVEDGVCDVEVGWEFKDMVEFDGMHPFEYSLNNVSGDLFVHLFADGVVLPVLILEQCSFEHILLVNVDQLPHYLIL